MADGLLFHPDCYLNLHGLRLVKNVAQTLRGEAQADTDGREGLRSLEILIAAYLSARDNQQVSLPLVY